MFPVAIRLILITFIGSANLETFTPFNVNPDSVSVVDGKICVEFASEDNAAFYPVQDRAVPHPAPCFLPPDTGVWGYFWASSAVSTSSPLLFPHFPEYSLPFL